MMFQFHVESEYALDAISLSVGLSFSSLPKSLTRRRNDLTALEPLKGPKNGGRSFKAVDVFSSSRMLKSSEIKQPYAYKQEGIFVLF